jgi:hypothetical protein
MHHIIKCSHFAALFVGIFIAVNSQAQTILSGNISGTWTPSGNPYIISANATNPVGQTLTIQPGVIVWIGQGISLTVNGAISAVGTSPSHITFQAPINSQYWNTISVNNSFTNLFNYCDFANATNALAFVGTGTSNQVNYCTFTNVMGTALAFNNQNTSGNQVLFSSFQNVSNGIVTSAMGNNWTNTTFIGNCSFSNCWGQALTGAGQGSYNGGYYSGNGYSGTIISTVQNCSFLSVGNGCSFSIIAVCGTYACGNGIGNVQLMDNIFNNVTNTAISLTTQNGDSSSSSATLINNIFLNASNGIISQDPWDATVMDGIFMGCTNAVTDIGALSRDIEFNDFYENATTFTGYTSDYGNVIIANRNGTPCDLLFNIYQNPLFVSSNSFALPTNSPCIDAGTPNVAYEDTSFPPSQGTGFPDLGIYGGPLAMNWLPVIPAPPAPIILIASEALKFNCTNVVTAGTYQLQTSTNLTSWANYGSQFYMTATSNLFQYVDATNNAGFFRLQSLQ